VRVRARAVAFAEPMSSPPSAHPEIQFKKPQFQCSLYQESGVLDLILVNRLRFRKRIFDLPRFRFLQRVHSPCSTALRSSLLAAPPLLFARAPLLAPRASSTRSQTRVGTPHTRQVRSCGGMR